MTGPSLEIAWFGALCDDDYRQLGVVEPDLLSTPTHCGDIIETADRVGFDNVLLPSGYELGIDGVVTAAAVAHRAPNIRMLLAVRCGEMWPPQLARQIATLHQVLGSRPDGRPRLTINIISSDLPGAPVESGPRYRRSIEVMSILRALLRGERVELDGETYQLDLDPPRITRELPEFEFYFGGLSEDARQAAALEADVFLMWPDRVEAIGATIDDMRDRASKVGRELSYGLRVHVIVRESEAEARTAASHLLEVIDRDAGVGEEIRQRSLDVASFGVERQRALREDSDRDGYIDDYLWTGIGRARSGCGAAIVGDPQQVVETIERFRDVGVTSFILSGYPHRAEAERFGRLVLPNLGRG